MVKKNSEKEKDKISPVDTVYGISIANESIKKKSKDTHEIISS